MMKNQQIKIFSPIVQDVYNSIPKIVFQNDMLTDSIAEKIDSVMKSKGISKKQLADMTHKKPSEVTKWLGGGHNFTCKTITLISNALGEDIIQVVK